MKKILNYYLTNHFEYQMRKRRIEPLLISMCLAKGEIYKEKKNKIKFVLGKEKIEESIALGYIKRQDYIGKSITIISKENLLITVYGRYGDTGIS